MNITDKYERKGRLINIDELKSSTKLEGATVFNYLFGLNKKFSCWDDDIVIRKNIKKIFKNVDLVEPDKLNFKLIKESFVTPGISLDHDKLKILKRLWKKDLFNNNCTNEKLCLYYYNLFSKLDDIQLGSDSNE